MTKETAQAQVIETIMNRKSVRGFLAKPIPQQMLESIFSIAQHAPSNCNTQPWQVAVVSGDACENLRGKISTDFSQGKMSMDFPYDGVYQGVYKERQHGAATALYSALGITREDKAARNEQFMKNFIFFGAPHAAFIFIPETFGIREAADIGMYSQTLMLTMAAHGIGSCPMTALSFNADLVRAELGLDASHRLLFGIAFGYEDPTNQVNNCRTPRAPLEQGIRFFV